MRLSVRLAPQRKTNFDKFLGAATLDEIIASRRPAHLVLTTLLFLMNLAFIVMKVLLTKASESSFRKRR